MATRTSRLLVLQPVPPKDHSQGAYLLMVLGGLVVALGISMWADGGVILVAFGGVFGGAAWMIAHSSKANKATAAKEAAEWLEAVKKTTDNFNARGELPAVDCPLSLQKEEVCYWAGKASWYEFRSVTTRVNYHGLTASIPIAKGLRYRLGSIAPDVERRSELVPLDHGELYITNKRLLFDGGEKNTTVTWKGLTQIQLFDGGIILEKNTGRSPHLMIESRATEAALIAASQL
jgi:hypothetical protein